MQKDVSGDQFALCPCFHDVNSAIQVERDIAPSSRPTKRWLVARGLPCLLAIMSPVYALDGYYLALTLLVTVAYQLSGFAIAWVFQFDKITDFTGGKTFSLPSCFIVLNPPTRLKLLYSWYEQPSPRPTMA